jgi:hypothetical protein
MMMMKKLITFGFGIKQTACHNINQATENFIEQSTVNKAHLCVLKTSRHLAGP